MSRDDLARDIHRVAHLTGTFTLRSGRTATEYFDKYRFEADPALLRRVAQGLAGLVPEGTEVLAGLELGGIPLATALSLETGLPAAFVRKEAKTYGTARLAEGAAVEGRRVCVVEDVITTGGQVIESAGELDAAGARILAVVCVIFRGDEADDRVAAAGYERRSLFSLRELDPAIERLRERRASAAGSG